MWTVRSAMLLLLVIIFISDAVPLEVSDKTLYTQAMARFNEKSYRKAITSFQELVRAFPHSQLRLPAIYHTGLAYGKLGEHTEAVKVFDELAGAAEGTIWEARAHWRKAQAIDDVRPQPFVDDKERKRRRMMSLDEFIRADEIYTKYPKFLDERCWMLIEKSEFESRATKDKEKAMITAQKVLDLHPSCKILCEALLLLGKIQYQKNGEESASRSFKRILELAPKSDYARFALSELVWIYESRDEIEAIKWCKKTLELFPGDKSAKERMEKYINPYLHLSVGDFFTQPGTKPGFQIISRNLDKVSIKAYKTDLVELFGSILETEKELRMDLPETPCAEWSVPVPDKGDYRQIITRCAAPLEECGAYVLEARSGDLISRNFAVITNLALLCTKEKDGVVLFAANMNTGEPLEGVELFSSQFGNHTVYIKPIGKTDRNGIFHFNTTKGVDDFFMIIGRKGSDYAFIPELFTAKRDAEYSDTENRDTENRTYLYTDRPVYRPGQKVYFRGIARTLSDGVPGGMEGGNVEISINNPKKEEVYRTSSTPTEFGTVNGEYTLPEKAIPGAWKIIADAWGNECSMEFFVEEYRKPEYIVSISSGRSFYCPGDRAEVNLSTGYYSGGPLHDSRVQYSVFSHPCTLEAARKDPFSWFLGEDFYSRPYYDDKADNETLVCKGEAVTDDRGKVSFSFVVPQSKKDCVLRVEARVSDRSRREVVENLLLKAPLAPWHVELSAPNSARYDESVTVRIRAQDITGSPCAVPLILKGSLVEEGRSKRVRGIDTEEIVVNKDLFSHNIDTGKDGTAEWSFVPKAEGRIRLQAVTPGMCQQISPFYKDLYVYKNSSGECVIHDGVVITPDRESYVPGEKAHVSITAARGGSYAFVSISGKTFEKTEVVPLSENNGTVDIPIDENSVPIVTIGAAVVKDGRIACGCREIVVIPEKNFLNLNLVPEHDTCHPGENSTITISARNSEGKPEKAEFSLDLVDLSLLALKGERPIDIRRFFYGADHRYSWWEPHSMFDFWLPIWQIGLNNGLLKLNSQLSVCCPPPPRPEITSTSDLRGYAAFNLRVRKDFPDTAFWSACIVTDDNGEAKVTVPLPDSLTTWRARAVGVTKDTKVGSVTAKIDTRKDFFVRLEMPRFLTQYDEALITGFIHNNTDKELAVRSILEADGIEILESSEKNLTVQAGKEGKAEWRVRAVKAGKARVCIKALVQGHSDAVELPLPVLPHGIEEVVYKAGEVSGGKSSTLALDLPGGAIPETISSEIVLSPSLAATLIESLDYLENYPFWCTEQATSRLYPFLLVKKVLCENNVNDESFEKKCESLTERCTAIIRENQNSDGGWGWWRDGWSSTWMTSYALMGLKEAMDCGMAFDSKSLEEGVSYIKSKCRRSDSHFPDEKALMLYVISLYQKLESPEKNDVLMLFRERDRLSDYGRALLLMLLDKAGEKEKSDLLVSNIEDRAQVLDNMAFYGAGDSTAHQKVEETAKVLEAFEKVRSDHPLVKKMIRYLVNARQGSHWETTVDSAAVVSALAHHLMKSRELSDEYPLSVSLNGKSLLKDRVTRENILHYPGKVDLSDHSLRVGKNECLIEAGEQCKSLSYSAVLRYFLLQEDIPEAGEWLRVKREYLPLGNSAGKVAELKEVPSGERFRVRVTMENLRDLDYLVLEDPRPAGCEVPTGAFDENQNIRVHRELHDDMTVFFFYNLRRGIHTIEYTLRAETPGAYHVMPASLSAMYIPAIRGRSAESRLIVK